MGVGRLTWRTPTGAMLWEIRGRHKWNFLWQGAGLAASVLFACWAEHRIAQDFRDVLGFAAFCCFVGAYGHLLICFSNIEVDAGRVQVGFPGRLLLKPVSTGQLVLVPMLCGGAVIVTVFVLWAELVLRQHLLAFTVADLLWTSTVLLSFFWWIQALAWSLPSFKGRMLTVFIVGVLHFLVWRPPPILAGSFSGWQKPMLAAFLVCAVPVAWTGLKLVRQGRWEGPSRVAMLWSRLRFARAWRWRKQFGSAFGAQLWLEWRGQGCRLPVISGGIAFLIVGVAAIPILMFRKVSAGAGQAGDAETVSLLSMYVLPLLILPLVLSVLLAPALATSDRFHFTGELPGYISIRPMTNGGFVLAKVLMALATSALTWLLTAAAFLFLALMAKGTLFSKAGVITPYGTMAYQTGCAPVLLLLVLWTWRNLVTGIGAGLSGRTWIAVVSVLWRLALLEGLFALVIAARTNPGFRETLLQWLTGILIVCLTAKIAISILAFVCGLHRSAITASAVGWIVGGWLVCGLFVTSYAYDVCSEINKPDLWIWAALGGFLILPLADLAIAPLALAWNRHR